jgi:isoleucyl-tRNA synthetase
MSKSRKNVVEPWDVLNKEGADALRWYLVAASPPWLPTRFDRKAETFAMTENRILVPKETAPVMVFDRHIFEVGGDGILAVAYDALDHAYLLKTEDQGKTDEYDKSS